ncbi:MAG: Trk system potassium transporter TrkA [Bacteroidales bacterium]|nr:Trk system potassium transporter TrkA [Bacteroidales bacterium]
MKIIIAGAGQVGTYLAKMLGGKEHSLAVIDQDESRLANLSDSADVTAIHGDPTSISVLKEVGIDTADLFVSVYPENDQFNIVASMIAKQLGAKKVTARVDNAEYLTHENKLLFTNMGIDLLFYPEKVAASEICDLLKQTIMSEYVDFAHGKLQLAVYRLEKGSELIDKTQDYFTYPQDDLPFKIIAISRGGKTIIPTQETKFRLYDLMFVIVRKESVAEAMKYSGKEDFSVRRIMILGGGKVGEMVAKKMENSADSVKLIEKNRDRCEELSQHLEKTLVINGDGRNSDLLYEEDIRNCDAFVAVTSSTETNILACMVAKRHGVPKTIAEVENLEYLKLAEGMGVDATINKKLITAGRMFRFTLSNKVRTIKCLNGSDAEVLEYIVNPDSLITKAPLGELRFPENAIIGGVIRGTESFIAIDSTQIMPYDRVAVFALPESLKAIDKFFV